ncbi:unnamed protein product [Candidula unifasciata]|uniref:Nudix hydrolase domain-containing protein n=1 Tax=Candidula unifasciata TaxID=100452 RepID=A0A8S3ZBZ7_9EUPU|nr:unnamed protein product [Candidula unifasciata]
MDSKFSHAVLKLLKTLNSVTIAEALERGCQPFYVDNRQFGLIRPDFFNHLREYENIFDVIGENKEDKINEKKPGVHLSSEYKTYSERTSAINSMLKDLREKNVIQALTGWRDENYRMSQRFTDDPVLEIERAGAGLFGFLQYGVHVNGYTREQNGDIWMWIARRSKTKQTFPDMYDNMCAGGLAANLGILECVKKECKEEASVSDEILGKLKFVGTISYFYEDERGLFPECQFVFDLVLPADFKPLNADGEVGSFQKCSVAEVKKLMTEENFKPNCAAVCLDFLIRHGHLNPDTDPNVSFYIEQLHSPLQTYYTR